MKPPTPKDFAYMTSPVIPIVLMITLFNIPTSIEVPMDIQALWSGMLSFLAWAALQLLYAEYYRNLRR